MTGNQESRICVIVGVYVEDFQDPAGLQLGCPVLGTCKAHM